ncbi:hypothetical protein Hanom_Chr06g00511531 [Helianthus anomalus]
MWIESEVMGVRITLKEETLRDVLQLGDDQVNTFLNKETMEQTMRDMGYHTYNVSRQVSKSGFIPPFQYLVTQLSVCFSKKIGHFNELSYWMMEVVHVVVQEKPYNLSNQLDFGGVRSWYPRAQMVLQENISDPTLVPSTNHNGHITYLWLYVKSMYNVLKEE